MGPQGDYGAFIRGLRAEAFFNLHKSIGTKMTKSEAVSNFFWSSPGFWKKNDKIRGSFKMMIFFGLHLNFGTMF